jgi:hypothetical protein
MTQSRHSRRGDAVAGPRNLVTYNQVKLKYPGRQIVVTETGWATTSIGSQQFSVGISNARDYHVLNAPGDAPRVKSTLTSAPERFVIFSVETPPEIGSFWTCDAPFWPGRRRLVEGPLHGGARRPPQETDTHAAAPSSTGGSSSSSAACRPL